MLFFLVSSLFLWPALVAGTLCMARGHVSIQPASQSCAGVTPCGASLPPGVAGPGRARALWGAPVLLCVPGSPLPESPRPLPHKVAREQETGEGEQGPSVSRSKPFNSLLRHQRPRWRPTWPQALACGSSVRTLGLPAWAVGVACEPSVCRQNRIHVRTYHSALPFSGSVRLLGDMIAVGFRVMASWCLHVTCPVPHLRRRGVQKGTAITPPAFPALLLGGCGVDRTLLATGPTWAAATGDP